MKTSTKVGLMVLVGLGLYSNSIRHNYKTVDEIKDSEPNPISIFVSEFSVMDLAEKEILRIKQEERIAELKIHKEKERQEAIERDKEIEKEKQKVAEREKEKEKQRVVERDKKEKLASRGIVNGGALENRKYRVEKLIVTAYAPFDNKSGICSDGNPAKTSTGSYPQHGTIAVNPKRFPYGTKFYIEGYSYGIALDTGGAMRKNSNKIDVYMDTYEQAMAWGKREIEVIVFEDDN